MSRRIAEVDLAQAESRFIAWDGVPKLKQMYLDGIDIHKYVAAKIFDKPMEKITYDERQMGKRTGHGANYKMGAGTFSENYLADTGKVLPIVKSQRLLDGYHAAFDGQLLDWQQRQIDAVTRNGYLDNPFGFRRYFYDRPGPAREREIVAHRPQSTVPQIANCLAMELFYNRPAESLQLLNQVHDSVWFEYDSSDEKAILDRIFDLDRWNPKLTLAEGVLQIPIDVKVGPHFGEMREVA